MKNRAPIPVHRALAGFSLLEVVLAVGIIAIILLGMQSAMLLASRATPDRANGNNVTVDAGRAVDQLSADLTYASSIITATANIIEFTVPDRNGDSSPETIRYSWSGVSGAPLLRSINGRPDATIAVKVSEFALVYDKRSQQRATTYTESGEVVLANNDGLGLLNLGDFTITSSSYCGQTFTPTLPGSAVKWRLTRVRFKASERSKDDGSSRVQIRTVSGGIPGTVIEEAMLYENTLDSNYTWKEYSFSNISGRLPGSSLSLVIQWDSFEEACYIQYQALLAADSKGNFVKTSNGGSTWSSPLGQDLVYTAYGTYSTADPVVTDYWVTNVRCTLLSGKDPSSRLRTTIRVLNEPQISGP